MLALILSFVFLGPSATHTAKQALGISQAASCGALCVRQFDASTFSKRGRLVPQTAKPSAALLRDARLCLSTLSLVFLSPSAA
jgi:hypothetical protein